MAQTAVSWLVNQINGHSHSIGLPYGMNIRIDIPDDIIEQAKAMEKEQIAKAYISGGYAGLHFPLVKDAFDRKYLEDKFIKYYESNYTNGL